MEAQGEIKLGRRAVDGGSNRANPDTKAPPATRTTFTNIETSRTQATAPTSWSAMRWFKEG